MQRLGRDRKQPRHQQVHQTAQQAQALLFFVRQSVAINMDQSRAQRVPSQRAGYGVRTMPYETRVAS